MSSNIGETICRYRQNRRMTQEEFASRLGVTPQAVSKWERGNGLPDASLMEGICSVLGIKADTLLGMEEKVVENGNPIDDREIKNQLIAEPVMVEFSETLIPLIVDGLETNAVYESRKKLAAENGMLLPMLRFRDNVSLEKHAYRVLVYGREVLSGVTNPKNREFYGKLVEDITQYCREHYCDILNKNLVKVMVDNLKNLYPGVADGLVPEQISYMRVEQKLKELLQAGENIKDLINIVEGLELEIME